MQEGQREQRRLLLQFLAASLVLILVAYGGALAGDFVWDDVMLVQENSALYEVGGLEDLLTSDLWGQATGEPTQLYHPIPMSSLWIQGLLHGPSIIGFRLGNLFFHFLASFFVYLWLRRLKCAPGATSFLALLFAVHPLATEPVVWVTGRHDLLGLLFTLLAAVVWPQWGKWSWPRGALASVATGLAFASKEPYVVAPGVVFLGLSVEYFGAVSATAPATRWRIALLRSAPSLLTVLGIVPVFLVRHALGIRADADILQSPPITHIENLVALLGHYGQLGFSFSEAPTFHLFQPPTGGDALLSALLAAYFVWGLVRAARNLIWLRAAVGVALFTGALVPHLISVPTYGIFANRYGYLPLVGLLTAASPLVEVAADTVRRHLRPLMVVALAALALCGVTLLTAIESSKWSTAESLYGKAAEQEPQNGIARFHLGHARLKKYGCRFALRDFLLAWELAPEYPRASHNVAGCLLREGRAAEAVKPARAALSLMPQDASRHFNLAAALAGAGALEEAYAHVNRSLELSPEKDKARVLQQQLETVLRRRAHQSR